jgi:hypothetical protein
MAVTSSSLSSGASIAAGSALVVPPTITRADLSPIRTNTRSIEGTPGIKGLRFPSDVGKYYMRIEINTYDRGVLSAASMGGFGTAGGVMSQIGSVILPLPQNLVDNNSTSFSEESMGDIVGGAIDVVSDGLGMAAASATRGISSKLINFGAIGDKASKIGFAAAGITPNKLMTVVLQGPQYKKHSFSWQLYPKTAQESMELNEIINLLKKSMRTKLYGQNFFFEFPKVFQLSFLPNQDYLYAFKPAVMESMSVNYTPSGSPNFYGKTGAPDGVTITMNFLELEYWLSEDAQASQLANVVGDVVSDASTGFKYGGYWGAIAGVAYGTGKNIFDSVAPSIADWWEGK